MLIPVNIEGFLQCEQCQFVNPEGPAQLVFLDGLHQILLPQDNPGLGSPKHFVPTKGDKIHTLVQHLTCSGLLEKTIFCEIYEAPTAQVFHYGYVVFSTQGRQLNPVYLFGESHYLEIAPVDF